MTEEAFYVGGCAFCDFTHRSTDPIDCNMAIIRHHCERKYTTVTDTVPPASLADPHRSLIRSVKGVFENMHRTMSAYDGEGDIMEVASSALAAAGHDLAALLKQRETDNAAYLARMEAEAKISADVEAAHEPSPQAVALTETAAQAEALASPADPAPAEPAPAPEAA